MTGELNTNSTIAIANLQNDDNQAVVNSAIMIAELRDYNKSMGVATYKTTAEMPEELQRALPDIEEIEETAVKNTSQEVIGTVPVLFSNSPYVNRPTTAGRGW